MTIHIQCVGIVLDATPALAGARAARAVREAARPASAGGQDYLLDDPAAVARVDGARVRYLVSILAGPNPRSAYVARRQAN